MSPLVGTFLALAFAALAAFARWGRLRALHGLGFTFAVFATGAKTAPGAALLAASPLRVAPGMSPLPPYQTIFGTTVGTDEARGLAPAEAWMMTWEPVVSQRA